MILPCFIYYRSVLKVFLRLSVCTMAGCFLITNAAHAQTCIPTFKKLYGGNGNDVAKDIQYTSDKGSVTVGQTTSNTAGDNDAFILKLSEQGVITWSKQLGGNADDNFTRVKPTADGGYIAIGSTRSFGNSNGEVFLVKMDNNGNLSWARHYSNAGVKTIAKEIIELTDGNFVFIANENDSSAQSNGIVCKLDSGGNVIWTKQFDQGNDDGFNYVMEDGNYLYVTGYATVDLRDAILMQLDKATGNVIYAKKFAVSTGTYDEIINISKIQNGIAFGVKSFNPLANSSIRLTLFKIRDNGNVVYERKISWSSTGRISWVNLIPSRDSGFVFVMYDTIIGFSKAGFVGPTGLYEWGQELYTFPEASYTNGLAKNGVDGYLFAGYINTAATGFKNRIAIFKTNITGHAGNCTQGGGGGAIDTSHYNITSFIWNSVTAINFTGSSLLTPAINNTAFTSTPVCEETYCYDSPPVPDGCNATFSIKYRGELCVNAWDITPTNDGGSAVVGVYTKHFGQEPLVYKLKPNGDVQWSKTLTGFIHTALFKKVITVADGSLVILGFDQSTVDHGVTNSSVILKVNPNTGQTIWSHIFTGDAYDMAATDDGGFVVCINRGWGSGSPYTFVIRIDASGNIAWQRQQYHFAGGPVYKSIICDGPFIYMAADFYNSSPNSVQVTKLIAATGQRVWSKRYFMTGESTLLQSISKIGDTLFLATDMPQSFGIMKAGMICVDLDGNPTRAFKLNSPAFSGFGYTVYSSYNEYIPLHFAKTHDNNFIVADQTTNGSVNSIAVTKFTGAGQILWSRNYPGLDKHIITGIKENASNLLLLGTRYLGIIDNSQVHDSYLLKTDSLGKVSDATTGECFSEPLLAQSIPATITTGFEVDDSVVVTNQIYMNPYTVYDRPVDIWAEVSCSIPAVCNSVAVIGATSTCNLSDTFLYTTQRNAGCHSPVTWQNDVLYSTIIDYTDSTVRVKYNSAGQTYIIAHLITDCGDFADTLFMNVQRNAASLYLGPDTAICENNTVIIKAYPGFKTYLWQDGSNKDSLAVNAPGLYYVTVTDSCGNQARDSVTVTPHAPILVNAGPDRTKCNTDTLQINAGAGFINYNWSPNYNISSLNSATINVSPLVDTAYFLKAEKTPGCFAFDTVNIKVFHSAPVNLGNDTSICKGTAIILNAGAGFASYLWNNGNTSAQITANTVGAYMVTCTDINNCWSVDTFNIINVYTLPVVRLDQNAELCTGSSRVLDAGSFVKYLWQDGSVNRTFTALTTGIYYVNVTDNNGCNGTDTAKITSLIPLAKNFLPADTSICMYETMKLQSIANFSSYLWNTGSTASSVTITQPGTYWLQVADGKNCISRDSIIVQPKQCLKGLYVPTAFTPNGDLKNDRLIAHLYGDIQKFEFLVYNRYGELVFRTTDVNQGWDGTINFVKQDTGSFVWICRYQLTGDPETIEHGMTTLIR